MSRARIGVIGAGAFREGFGLEVAMSPETGRSVPGAEKQQRLLACAPLPVDGALLERVFRESL